MGGVKFREVKCVASEIRYWQTGQSSPRLFVGCLTGAKPSLYETLSFAALPASSN